MEDLSIDGVDLTDQAFVLKESVMAPEFRELKWRVWRALGGFGCSPTARGSAVFARCVEDGEECRWERYQIERLATQDEVNRVYGL